VDVVFRSFKRHDGASFTPTELPAAKVSYTTKSASLRGKRRRRILQRPYSTYARGLDILLGTYNLLDLTPKGRDEGSLKSSMAWLRHHDKYGDSALVSLSLAASKGETK
jgi:predicted dithiol-disulfide oxidoreductase (DUF899 family)